MTLRRMLVRIMYTTHKVTRDVQNWITKVKESKDPKTFAYVAHEAVHGPLEVPLSYVKGQCEESFPRTGHRGEYIVHGTRCGRKRRKHYENLQRTRHIQHHPVHSHRRQWRDTYCGWEQLSFAGNKSTTFEGGVRSIAFASGAGIHPGLRGSVSHELMHLTDWLPTIVEGIAGLSLADNTTGRPCPTCTRRVEPLDGVNQ